MAGMKSIAMCLLMGATLALTQTGVEAKLSWARLAEPSGDRVALAGSQPGPLPQSAWPSPRRFSRTGYGIQFATFEAAPELRISGSNTLGLKLMPALVEAWLKQEGATMVERAVAIPGGDVAIKGRFAAGVVKRVLISAHGSSTAFDDLEHADVDIGMASRRASLGEVRRLAHLGPLWGPQCEHVIGLDGLAVVVHAGNPISALRKDQVAAVFSGRLTDWRQLGASAQGKSGKIALYVRDEKSGTFDTFQHLVMGSAKLAPDATRIEDSEKLSDAVSKDPNAIGFIGLPYVRAAKALGISDKGTSALYPNRLTVLTEDYLLSRRLYLYTAAAPANSNVARFLAFVKGRAGQAIVAQQGFFDQTVSMQPPGGLGVAMASGPALADYQNVTFGAQRLSLNFRFHTGSRDLDNKAVPDLDRVVKFLAGLPKPAARVLLFGFADARGSQAKNLALSRDRAQAVADALRQRGKPVSVVTGFGAALPVASNDTPDGQEKNRRVEIWVAP